MSALFSFPDHRVRPMLRRMLMFRHPQMAAAVPVVWPLRVERRTPAPQSATMSGPVHQQAHQRLMMAGALVGATGVTYPSPCQAMNVRC